MFELLTNLRRRWIMSRIPEKYRFEVLPYRPYLFDELLEKVGGAEFFKGKSILEIGPKDGLDSKRFASLTPSKLVLLDLPDKHDMVKDWINEINCQYEYIEGNFLYMNKEELACLGTFDLIWCTGVLYHNAEQLRFIRKLYKLLNVDGWLVLESSTLRLGRAFRQGHYVEVFWPDTYRNSKGITHLPSAPAIRAWLMMAGFEKIIDSECFRKTVKFLDSSRMAVICQKLVTDRDQVYLAKRTNEPYRFGDSA